MEELTRTEKMKLKLTREPVMTTAVIAGIITGIIMAVALGWLNLNQEQISSIENFVTIIVPLVAMAIPIISAWFARQRVTPMAAPRTADGKAAVIVSKEIE